MLTSPAAYLCYTTDVLKLQAYNLDPGQTALKQSDLDPHCLQFRLSRITADFTGLYWRVGYKIIPGLLCIQQLFSMFIMHLEAFFSSKAYMAF